MKKLAISTLSAFAVLAALNTNALAADTGTVNFTGNVIGQTCEVMPANESFGVELLPVSTAALSTAGATTDAKSFSISLTDCTSVVGGVYAFFEAGSTVDNGRIINATGTATNVAVELLDSDDQVINVGSAEQRENPATAAVTDGSATLSYSARYVATGGAATAGSVITFVNYSIAYL